MIPFSQLVQYGNTVKPPAGLEIYSQPSGLHVFNPNTNKLYSTGTNSAVIGIGTTTAPQSTFVLNVSNVKRVLSSKFNSSDILLYESTDSKIYICGRPVSISTSTTPTFYTGWVDITSMFSAVGLEGKDIKSVEGYSNLKLNVLTNDGRLFCAGKNLSTGMSSFWNDTEVNSPNALQQIVLSGINGTIIKTSGNLFLTSTGFVYGTGNNQYYQLGLGTTTNTSGCIQIATGVKDITAAFRGNYLLDINDNIKASGTMFNASYDEYGLDRGTTIKALTTYTQTVGSDAVQIGSNVGNISSSYISITGKLYSTGLNSGGAAGIGIAASTRVYTVAIDFTPGINCRMLKANQGTLIQMSDGTLWYSGIKTQVLGSTGNQNTFIQIDTTQFS